MGEYLISTLELIIYMVAIYYAKEKNSLFFMAITFFMTVMFSVDFYYRRVLYIDLHAVYYQRLLEFLDKLMAWYWFYEMGELANAT